MKARTDESYVLGIPNTIALALACAGVVMVVVMFWTHSDIFGHSGMVQKAEDMQKEISSNKERINTLEKIIIKQRAEDSIE